MGFAFIDKYDVQACADLCNTREADSNGGACEYFNIWRAMVKGIPTTYTCSMVRDPKSHPCIFGSRVCRSTSYPQMRLLQPTSDKVIYKSHFHVDTSEST